MFKYFTHFKSTLLGFLFIGLTVFLMVESITFDYTILGTLASTGILLLFTPDKFINALEKYVFGKVLFQKDQEK